MKVLDQKQGDGWALYNGDCIDVVASMPDRYVALQEGRRFVGAELKPSYYRQACANLSNAKKQLSLFEGKGDE